MIAEYLFVITSCLEEVMWTFFFISTLWKDTYSTERVNAILVHLEMNLNISHYSFRISYFSLN